MWKVCSISSSQWPQQSSLPTDTPAEFVLAKRVHVDNVPYVYTEYKSANGEACFLKVELLAPCCSQYSQVKRRVKRPRDFA